jgi:hypothetical protein
VAAAAAVFFILKGGEYFTPFTTDAANLKIKTGQ